MLNLKKAMLAMSFACAFCAVGNASADTITRTYDFIDTTITNGSTRYFDASITGSNNGFVVNFDKLVSATLSIFLRDDKAGDFETYKFILGSSQTQTFSDNDLVDTASWENTGSSRHPIYKWVYSPGTVTENVSFNTKALADLGTDGMMRVYVQSVFGDFIVDKAILTADVTRGIAPPSSVPEPTTVALLGLGLLGFAASRRKTAK